jgi:hypothetical protein
MKVDMSPRAIAGRLRSVSDLRDVCLKLAGARVVVKDGPAAGEGKDRDQEAGGK